MQVISGIHECMKEQDCKKAAQEKWAAARDKMLDKTPNEDFDKNRARAFCEALELCTEQIHLVRVNTANLKLRAMASVIRDHGVEYERMHFDKKLNAGNITLERTEGWIAHVLKGIAESKDERVSLENAKSPSLSCREYDAIFRIAVVDLAAGYSAKYEAVFPETMLNDLKRFQDLCKSFHLHVEAATVLITVDQVFIYFVHNKCFCAVCCHQ